jgi:LysM repeat protein
LVLNVKWNGPAKKFYLTDDAPDECFRVYETARESYTDHSEFLLTRSRYADLFKLRPGDYKSWAHGLKTAGYATNPKYALLLISYIEQYQLHLYDEIGYAMIQNRDKLIAAQSAKTLVVPESNKPVEMEMSEESRVTETATLDKPTREEFLINGVRAIKAVGNEDPFAIALDYNIDYLHVLSFNDLITGDKFKDGEYIYLQPKKSRGGQATYTVKAGENMRDIAQALGVRQKDLYYKNRMSANDQPLAGETLNLQEKRTAAPKTMTYAAYLKSRSTVTEAGKKTTSTTAAPLFTNDRAYEVQQKDTLYSIARKFNTTVDKIKELNRIDDSTIKPGQTLVVSQ